MLTVYATKHLTWENNTTSVNHYEMFADTLSDLPTDAYYFSTEQGLYKIAQGSVAWVIATAELYMFKSDGTWVLETTGGGAISTGDYENLSNKPKINDVELDGNKTSANLGLQSAIDSTHKLDADLVDDTNATNKFATAEELQQIETNKTNILSIQDHIKFDSSSKTYYLQQTQPANPAEGDIWIG